MPNKPSRELSPAALLFNGLQWTPENRRRIASAYIAETGDIPLNVEGSFCMGGPERSRG